MAIVKIDPPEWEKFNVVQIDSDAPDNTRAIIEMEDWASEHGFARTNEYWLRKVRTGDRTVFRGICFRLTEEERRSNEAACLETEAALARMPVTPHLLER